MTTTTTNRTGAIGTVLRNRRTELGMERAEVARRAGVDPDYLAYLEEQGGEPSGPVLRRLALALRSTVRTLRGTTPAVPRRHLAALDEEDCWRLLSTGSVGRVAFAPAGGPPVVHLVNYVLLDRAVVIRTGERTQLAYAARAFRRVTFEADRLDEEQRTGWSVLVSGAARPAPADKAARMHVDDLVEPWADGERQAVVVIHPDRVTGRRITPIADPAFEPYEGRPSS